MQYTAIKTPGNDTHSIKAGITLGLSALIKIPTKLKKENTVIV